MEKNNKIKNAIRAYKLLHTADKFALTLLMPISIIRAIKPYIALYATAYIIDGLIALQPIEKLVIIALIAVGMGLLTNLLESFLSKIQAFHNDIAVTKMHMGKAEKYLSMDYVLLESSMINDINARINRDNTWGGGFHSLSNNLINLFDNFLGFAVGIIMLLPLFYNNKSIGGIITFVFFISLTVFTFTITLINSRIVQTKITKHLNSSFFEDKFKYSTYFIERSATKEISKTVRIYNAKSIFEKYINEEFRQLDQFGKKFTKYRTMSGFLGSITNGVLIAAAYIFVVAKAVSGSVPVGNVVRYAGTIYNMAICFFGFASAVTNLIDETERIQSTLDFMEFSNVLYKGNIEIKNRSEGKYEIEFHDVSFKYPDCENYALRHFSFKLNVGEKIAIVGMNGSGKTTMIKLLCRFYDPTEGLITLNGVNIREYNYSDYMNLFSVVFQDFKLYSFTLAQNLACSNDINIKLAEQILNNVGIGERYETMQQKLNTYLYNDFDEGIEISGGEAQKIALARALYKNSPFILLDEPTSALDPISEYEIYNSFNKLVKNKTAIYISHRLSSCRFCNDILVFNEGQLIQRGSHKELISNTNGKYYELWTAQAQHYVSQ